MNKGVLKFVGLSMVFFFNQHSSLAQTNEESNQPSKSARLILGSSASFNKDTPVYYYIYGGANRIQLSDDVNQTWANGLNVVLQGYYTTDNSLNPNNELNQRPNWFASMGVTVENKLLPYKKSSKWSLLFDIGPELRLYPRLDSQRVNGTIKAAITFRDYSPVFIFSSMEYGVAFSPTPISFGREQSSLTNFSLLELFFRMSVF